MESSSGASRYLNMAPVNNWWWLVLLLLVIALGLLEEVDGAVSFGGKIYDDPAFCEGRVSAYFVSDNVNINSSASFVMRNISESRCLDLCSANRDSKGRWVFCASVIYDRDRDICAIHRRGSAPDGSAEREPESGKRYFEKFCLPEDLPLDCADRQFVRVDQFILKGYAQTTSTYPTMAECAAHCVREKKFQCKSAMYFYEEGECITNTESAITRPDDFTRPDDDDKVVFFHNGCIGSRHNSEDDRLDESATTPTSRATTEQPPSSTRLSTPTSRAHKTLPIGKNVRKAEPKRQRTLKPSSISIEESTDAGEPIELPFSSSPVTTTSPTTTTARSRPSLVRRTKKKTEMPHSTSPTMPPTTPPSTASRKTKEEDVVHGSGEGKFKVSKEDLSRSEEIDPEKFRAPKISIEAPKRLYGAKALERAEDGSIRESTVDDRPISHDGEEKESKATSAEPPKINHASTASISAPHQSITYVDAPKTKVHKPLGVADAGESASASPKRLRLKSIKQTPLYAPTESTTSPAPLHLERREVVVKSNSSPRPAILNTNGGDGGGGPFDEEGESGFFSKWGAWTQCTQPGERRVRRRRCLDLRRCKGALMQVDYCPQDTKALPTDSSPQQEEGPSPPPPVRNPLPVNAPEQNSNGGSPPSILPPKLPDRELKPLPEGAPGSPTDVWSPWEGACQRFASPQPCTRHEMIGFESRECIAKDPAACKGPFFRYCRIPC